MPTLKEIMDYGSAPLCQWEPVVGEPLLSGKAQEDVITHQAIAGALRELGVKKVTGIISDEARLELYLSENLPGLETATHLTLSGAFENAAINNVQQALESERFGAECVDVHINTDLIPPRSQDAVVMNMILGCLARPNDTNNIRVALQIAHELLHNFGALVIVRPNPAGGKFSTYECITPPEELQGGANYKFIVDGLEPVNAMDNLHISDAFLKTQLNRAGFDMGETQDIQDNPPTTHPAFLLNICTPR